MKQNFVRLTEHCSILECGANDRPNIGLVRGTESFLVIDCGNSRANAELFINKAEIKGNHQGQILLTHHHWDHVCGSVYYDLPVKSSKITSQKIQAQQKFDWDKTGIEANYKNNVIPVFTRDNMIGELSVQTEMHRYFFKTPDETADGEVEFNPGGLNVIYTPIVSCHTEGQMGVFVKEDKVFFIGDVLWPFMDCNQKDWYYDLKTFEIMKEQLLSFDAELYVESHAAPIPRKKLEKWLDAMAASMKNGKIEVPEEAALGYEDVIQCNVKNLQIIY